VRDGFDQHGDGGKRRRRGHLGHNMRGNAEGAVGMKGFGTGVAMGRFEGTSDQQQEDTQNADQQPRSTGPTASWQRF